MAVSEEILEQVHVTQELVKTLIRNKRNNKVQSVYDELRVKGRLTTRQVMDLLEVTRTYALTVMEKIGNDIGYSYIKGDSAKRKTAAIVFRESDIIKQQSEAIKKQLSKEKTVTLADIMKLLQIDIKEALTVAKEFVYNNKNTKFDENRILLNTN